MKFNKLFTNARPWIKQSSLDFLDAWDHFWFTARHIETLACLRIITGAMLLYSHLVLATDLSSFLGTEAWINNETAEALHDGRFGESTAAWSYLWKMDSPGVIAVHHFIVILVSAAFMVGFLTRITGPLAWFFQLMIVHRLMGSLFGLDQIVTYSAMYLAFTPCGAVFSVDAWLRRRLAGETEAPASKRLAWLFPDDGPSVSANVGTRLFQLHLCVIYLFGGLAKARGQMWWDGTALWYAVGNYEYQSWDATFLAAYPSVFTALTHITLLWEVFYCALVWPRWSRPITLALAVAVHGGIAIVMGMATFGIMMIAANGIFIGPALIRRLRGRNVLESIAAEQPAEAQVRSTTPTPAAPVSAEEIAEIAALKAEMEKRAAELEKGEEAFRKRYKRLKAREAKVEERNERIKVTKAKLRQRLEDGTLVLGDRVLDSESGLSSIGLSGIGLNESHEDVSDEMDDELSGHDLLNPYEE